MFRAAFTSRRRVMWARSGGLRQHSHLIVLLPLEERVAALLALLEGAHAADSRERWVCPAGLPFLP